jgi:hypothetical protein
MLAGEHRSDARAGEAKTLGNHGSHKGTVEFMMRHHSGPPPGAAAFGNAVRIPVKVKGKETQPA